MKSARGFCFGLYVTLVAAQPAFAETSNISLDANIEAGALYPIEVQIVSGEDEGIRYLSVVSEILESPFGGADGESADADFVDGLDIESSTCPEDDTSCTETDPNGGIVLEENEAPVLRTDILFTPVVCGLTALQEGFGAVDAAEAAIEEAGDALAGLLEDELSELGDTVADSIAGAIDDGSSEAWFVPAFAETVVAHLQAEPRGLVRNTIVRNLDPASLTASHKESLNQIAQGADKDLAQAIATLLAKSEQ